MECYNEQGQQINYKCDYQVNMSFGNYELCGISDPSNVNISNGYKFKKITGTNNSQGTPMCEIIFQLNKVLGQKTQIIHIYDDSWGLLGYNVKPIIQNQWTWFAPIESNLSGKELTVVFNCLKESTDKDKARQLRNPMIKIFSIKIQLPKFVYCKPDDVCCMCLKSNPNHITKCVHKFHNTCLFEYLGKLNLIKESNCPSCNVTHFKEIVCPMCDSKQLTKSIINSMVFKLSDSFEVSYSAFY